MKKRFFFLILTAVLMVSAFACGRKGPPTPDFNAFNFLVTVSQGSLNFNSINIQGKIVGNSAYLSHVVLEVQTVGDEYCEGCPFLPQASKRIDANDLFVDGSDSLFSINFRPPLQSEKYRFRIIGYNSMPSSFPVSTPLYLLEEGMDFKP